MQAREIIAGQDLIEEGRRDEDVEEKSPKCHQIGIRLCNKCRKTGHNTKTYPEATEANSLLVPIEIN